MLRKLWFATLLCLSCCGLAAAHGPAGEVEADGPPVMDCEHPPEEALQAVPEELRDWVAMACDFEGMQLVQSAEWQWRYPGSYFDRPVVTARLGEATERRHDGPWYFKRLEKIKLTEEQRDALHRQLAQDVPLYGEHIRKLHALVVVNTVNNYDEIVTLNLAFDVHGHVMGLPCTVTCRPEHAFYMERRK